MRKIICILLALLLTLSGIPFALSAESAVLYGDVNGDRRINAKDALVVLQYSVNSLGQGAQTPTDTQQDFFGVADVNRDDKIDAKDALQILRKAVNKSVVFPNTLLAWNKEETVVRVGSSHYGRESQSRKQIYKKTFEDLRVKKQIGTYIQPVEDSLMNQWLTKESLSGMNEFDVLEITPAQALTLAKKNAIANLNLSTTLTSSAFLEWATEYMSFGDQLYGVSIRAVANDPLVFVYNKDWMERRGISLDVAALVNQNQWTVNRFTQLLQQGTYLEQTSEDTTKKYFGFTGDEKTITHLMTAFGGPIGYKSQGKVICDSMYDRFYRGINVTLTIYKYDRTFGYKSYWEDALNSFVNQEAMSLFVPVSQAQTMAKSLDFSVGIAPMPLGENQTQYVVSHSNPRVYVVPKQKENRLEEIGTWLNTLAHADGKLVNATAKELVLLTGDNSSWYVSALKNQTWDYAMDVVSQQVTSQIYGIIYAKNPYQVPRSIEACTNKELDDFYHGFYSHSVS